MDLTNKRLVKLQKNLTNINKRLAENKKKSKKLLTAINRDMDIVRTFANVSGEIINHNGKLLDVYVYPTVHGRSANIIPLADNNNRIADIYPNAHNNGKTFGGNLRVLFSSAELWLGSQYESFDYVLQICMNFVADGTINNKHHYYNHSFQQTALEKMEKD